MQDKTLEQCISIINSAGYGIHSMHQHPEGHWSANLFRPGIAKQEYWQYGLGDTAKLALLSAFAKARIESGEVKLPKAPRNWIKGVGEIDLDLDALLGDLGE